MGKMGTISVYGDKMLDAEHTSSEYAEKQKQESLDIAGKIDVEGFLKDITGGERCFVRVTANGKTTSETELGLNEVYTIWFNEKSKKWMCMPSKIRMGEDL